MLRDVSPTERLKLERELHQHLGGVEIVKPGVFARYVVDAKGKTVRILGADGMEEVASFSVSDVPHLTNQIGILLSRSATVSDLMALEHPSSQVKLEVRLVQNQDPQESPNQKMGHTIYSIRKRDEKRTGSNSVQFEVWSDTDGYLTIMDVDANGHVNLLFPNPHQKAKFLPEGFIRGGTGIRIPDSLENHNRAGFHWDIVDPPGMDTVQFFLTTDYHTARLIRKFVRERMKRIQLSGTRGGHQGSSSEPGFDQLRGELIKQVTRGVMTVPNQTNSNPLITPSQPENYALNETDWTSTSLSLRIVD